MLQLQYHNIDPTIQCAESTFDQVHIASKDNLFSHVQLFKEDDKYVVRYGCIRRTTVLEFNDLVKKQLKDNFYTIPYELKDKGSVAILGAGAGIEVERALAMDYQDIVGIEINKDIIDLINQTLVGSKNPYNHDRVHLIIGEARRELSKLEKKFDLIYIPHSGKYGVIGINGLTVSNYLFTKEAMEQYYDQLTDTGTFAFAENGYFVHFNIDTLISVLKEKNVRGGEILLIQTKRYYEIAFLAKEGVRKSEAERLQSSAGALGLFKKGGFSEDEIKR
ncbi:hypothetical protein IIA95_04015, partial [Patescibacteria group bacterium]|nr:hypothetical protein [Patescibacteria group bacterium]